MNKNHVWRPICGQFCLQQPHAIQRVSLWGFRRLFTFLLVSNTHGGYDVLHFGVQLAEIIKSTARGTDDCYGYEVPVVIVVAVVFAAVGLIVTRSRCCSQHCPVALAKNSSLQYLIAKWMNWRKPSHQDVSPDVWMERTPLAATNRGRKIKYEVIRVNYVVCWKIPWLWVLSGGSTVRWC